MCVQLHKRKRERAREKERGEANLFGFFQSLFFEVGRDFFFSSIKEKTLNKPNLKDLSPEIRQWKEI